jgi:hypothetical protein
MNIIDLRKKLLQSSTERRVYSDRRGVPYQFGSPEWQEYIKNNNIKCPEEDRRQLIRREADRGLSVETEDSESNKTHRRILLTPGERKLLQDIYLSDLEDLDY